MPILSPVFHPVRNKGHQAQRPNCNAEDAGEVSEAAQGVPVLRTSPQSLD